MNTLTSDCVQDYYGIFLHCTFTGKERDAETGYGYFGARYLDHELMTMWLSVDPMSDKYPSISPYAYCAWNPVKLVDPDGREVYITGDAADQATRQLSSKGLTVNRDKETGKLSYTKTGEELSASDKKLMKAIDSRDITVNVNATTASRVAFEGTPLRNDEYTGQFLGVNLNDCKGIWPFRKRTAETSQLVNPDVCEYRDNQYKVDVGTSMRHEITESFEAGKICISEGISCGPSWRDWCGVKINGTDDHVYELAHGRATPQAATVRARLDEIRAQKRAEARNALQGSGFNPHPTRR